MNTFAQIDRLIIDFKPSFIVDSKLIIERKDEDYLIIFESTVFYEAETDNVFREKKLIDGSKLNSLESYFEGDNVYFSPSEYGLDGIIINGELQKDDKKITFEFWSPDKDSKNHNLIVILFDIMFSNFNNPKIINYLEQLEQYFFLD